jgi:hypothetical protein
MAYGEHLGLVCSPLYTIWIPNRVVQRHAQGCRKPFAPSEPGRPDTLHYRPKPILYTPLRDPSQRVGIPGEGRVRHLVGFVLTTRIKTLDIAKLE